MQPRICAMCGAEFTPKMPNQKYCSKECAKKVSYPRLRDMPEYLRDAAEAFSVSQPVALCTLQCSRRKPANTSAVRWRIELRRRANPKYYADCEAAI